MLKRNSEILIMNCIYKINRYKMSLLIIIEIIALNIFFFVNFCFIATKKTSDYVKVLKQLKLLYIKLRLSHSIMILINCERDLINAFRSVFSRSLHLLCMWHINKNVLINCRKHFNTEESWQAFYKTWHLIMYVKIEAKYED